MQLLKINNNKDNKINRILKTILLNLRTVDILYKKYNQISNFKLNANFSFNKKKVLFFPRDLKKNASTIQISEYKNI